MPELLQAFGPPLFIINKISYIVTRSSKNIGHQCAPYLCLVSRITQGRKQDTHLHSFRGRKNSHIALHHCGNTPCTESSRNNPSLSMSPHNNSNVSRSNRPAARLPGYADILQKTADLIGYSL